MNTTTLAEDGPGLLKAFADYLVASISLDAPRVSFYIHEPFMDVSAAQTTILRTRDEAEAYLLSGFESLRRDGYARTEFPELGSQSLSDGLTLISGVAIRYKTDGTELSSIGMTYLWRKVAGGWKLAVKTRHDPSKILPLG
jgi:hypothetical protein